MVTFEYLIGKTDLRGRPYTLTIDPNNFCNLNCKFCPTGQGNSFGRKRQNMSFVDFKKVFDQFKEYIFILHLYIWGEPFLNKDIYRMISYARTNNVFVSVSTNLNIENSEIDNIIDSGLDHLIIGLDGTDQETYKRYRVGGDFDLVISNIEKLVDKKRKKAVNHPLIQLQFLIFNHNKHKIFEMKELARNLGVDQLDFLKSSWHKKKHLVDLKFFEERDDLKIHRCVYPWVKALIFSDGGFSVCCYSPNKTKDIGNIYERSFKRLWNSPGLINIRKKQVTGVGKQTVCDLCQRWEQSSSKQ
ncbi:MAG: radical SAM/SPASM domain-containing protein [Candidatus Woesearchaeota archaeon]